MWLLSNGSSITGTGFLASGSLPLQPLPDTTPQPTSEQSAEPQPTSEPTSTAPASEPTATPSESPTPQPTVTVTETVQAEPSGPQAVIVDSDQFSVFMVSAVLVVMFLAAILFAQMRRP